MLQRVALRQHREAPHPGEREEEQTEVRREHQCQHQQHPAVRQHRAPAGERTLAQCRAAARERGVIAPPGDPGGERERADREHDHHQRDHIADRILEPDRRDAQVRLRRQHVGDVEHERRAEIVEHLDEHQRGARDKAWRREREHDAAEQPEAVTAEVLRRLLHRAVDVPERGDEIEQDERKVMQPFDEDDAIEAVHERDADAESFAQQQVDRAVAAEQQLQRHRAHERRHHERQHAQRMHQRGAAELEAHGEVGEWNGDERRKRDRSQRHHQAVDERLAHQRDRQERTDVAGREAALPVGERRVEDGRDGPGQEDDDEGRDGQREQPGAAHAARCRADRAGGDGHRVRGKRARAVEERAAAALISPRSRARRPWRNWPWLLPPIPLRSACGASMRRRPSCRP